MIPTTKEFFMSRMLSVVVMAGVAGLLLSSQVFGQISQGPTGNYYEAVIVLQISWNEANTDAQQSIFDGKKGHLAIITSQEEDIFLESLRQNVVRENGLENFDRQELWVGGFQPPNQSSPKTGWRWVNNEGQILGTNGGALYANWLPGEPNDYSSPEENNEENHLVIGYFGQAGWNDNDSYPQFILGYIVEFENPQASSILANSVTQFSGTQGKDGWFYGYYNQSQDADALYQITDFQGLPLYSPGNIWEGLIWELELGPGPPWTALGSEWGHPNGPPHGETHWAVRRWVSNYRGEVQITGESGKKWFGMGGGDGTEVAILVDGSEVFSRVVPADDDSRTLFSVSATLNVNSLVDFVIRPRSTDDYDSTAFYARISAIQIINQPPQITHAPITSAIQNKDIKVEFEAKDPDGNLSSVELFYRVTGASDYQSVGMSPAPSQTQFTLEIPASAVTLAGVDYYIEAKDADGLVGTHGTAQSPHHIKVIDKYPVIIIPGIMGTHLNRINALGIEDRVWIDRTQACGTSPSDSFLNALVLDEDGHNSLGETILLGPILKSGFGINFYGNLIQYLVDHGNYRENIDLFDCPYDWRLDNMLSAWELSSRINTVLSNTGAEKVNIIAHSMGGLVTRSYIHRYGENKIDKIIYLGTPHQGSTKSFNALAFDEGLHDFGLKFDCLDVRTLSNLAITLPSVYQLLPRNKFIYDWRLKQDIELSEAYKGAAQGGFLRSDRWVSLANTFHSNISNPISSKQYVIAGTGCATIDRIMVRMEKNRIGGKHRCWFGRYSNGDDTVPQESAIAALGSNITVFYVDRVPHANLPGNENVDRLILDILQDNLSDPLPLGIAQSPFDLPREGLVVFNTCSPIMIHITDEAGNMNAKQQDGSIGEDIPFSSFLSFEDSQGGVLVRNQIYELRFDAIETGECSLSLEYLSANGDIIDSAEYTNFPVRSGTTGITVLVPDSTTPEISLDLYGNGSEILSLSPNTEAPQILWEHFAENGDANKDGGLDVSDGIAILSWLFLGNTIACKNACDTNNDTKVDVSDPIYLLEYLFLGTQEKPKGLIFCQ